MLDTGKPYILLVDDTEANLRVLGPLLSAEGWAVAAAIRGEQALRLIEQRRPDLVLLDIMMPEMDGFEVCRRLRAQVETRDLPILFITALTDEENIVRGFREGGQDYIIKPFRPAELIARVRTHLALRATTRRVERQAAELAKLNADKDRFFSIIAHDLRSPLAGLLGVCEAMSTNLAEFTPSEIAEATGDMSKSARNLYQLLENLLEWSQLQTGRMECRHEEVALDAVLAELADLFSQSSQQKGVMVRLETKPATAWGDHRMVHAIFRNLLSNALKFTPAGGTVTLRSFAHEGRIIGEVGDTGTGLSPEQLKNLLVRGSKPVSQPGTAGESGTGLGLTLCLEMIELVGGSITARSALGQGSVFAVSLAKPSGSQTG